MRRRPFLLAVLLLAGCGHTTTRTVTQPLATALTSQTCVGAQNGHGSMGGCTPPSVGLGSNLSVTLTGPVTYPDLSNNNPVTDSQMAAIGRSHPAVYLKVNQGTGFIDRTFMGMARSARAHGMATGGYDFVSCYCAAEARVFVAQLRLAGMTRTSARWLPPVLDVEYANATRSGLQAMLAVVVQAFGRVGIYTGNWFWAPHLGCYWPRVDGWLAGYPNASPVCGMPGARYVAHQFSDRAYNGATTADMTVWLGSVASFRTFAGLAKPKPRPKPHKHVTRGDRLECRHLQYDRRHKPPYLGAAHHRWRTLHAVGVTCSRHGAYLTHHRRKP